jgi:hypothetical protein
MRTELEAHLTVTPALSLRQRILALKPAIPGHPSQTGVLAGPTSFPGGRPLHTIRRGKDQEKQHPPP